MVLVANDCISNEREFYPIEEKSPRAGAGD